MRPHPSWMSLVLVCAVAGAEAQTVAPTCATLRLVLSVRECLAVVSIPLGESGVIVTSQKNTEDEFATDERQTAHVPDTPVLHAETQMVVVDVTVEDKDGHSVHGLRREDFTLTESNQPQSISFFEEYSSHTTPIAGPKLPPMPPGAFTDYTPVPPNGALNILLLDTLNTPMADQSYVRSELRQYVRKATPGTRIAIFGLSQRLFLLQGFNSDPQILKDVVEHKLTLRGSNLLDDALGVGTTPDMAPTGGTTGTIASNMQQFEAEQRAFQTQLRLRYTLDAFNDLAHYLSAFPGRKNLIWFSDSFPINILPDATLNDPFIVMENNSEEFRETTDLLARAQVAVYPVDARGLMVDPTFSAVATARNTGLSTNRPGKSSAAFYQSQADEHTTMSQLAKDTGGKAFYNTNDLASAVQSAIESGSSYYTLMYSPADKSWNGAYRPIRVTLNGRLQAAGYQLTYRHGYYSDDANHPRKDAAAAAKTANSIASISSGDLYAKAAMAHGAPMPQDILFKVRVLPVGKMPEQALAVNNISDPVHPVKPPFRRFAVDLVAVGRDFHLALNSDGHRTGAIKLSVFLYDNDGRLLNATGKTIELNLTPEAYRQFLSGVSAHFEISVPTKDCNDFLRIGVHDLVSNRSGVVEIPIAVVAHLTPLPITQPAIPTQTLPANPGQAQKQ